MGDSNMCVGQGARPMDQAEPKFIGAVNELATAIETNYHLAYGIKARVLFEDSNGNQTMPVEKPLTVATVIDIVLDLAAKVQRNNAILNCADNAVFSALGDELPLTK